MNKSILRYTWIVIATGPDGTRVVFQTTSEQQAQEFADHILQEQHVNRAEILRRVGRGPRESIAVLTTAKAAS